MKKSFLTLFLVFALSFANAQVVSIPDINFKLKLIEQGVDTNKDGLIQQSEAIATKSLAITETCIVNFTGLNSFYNLENFKYIGTSCSSNSISISFSNLLKLQKVDISAKTQTINLNLDNNIFLNTLKTENINFDNISINACPNIKVLYLHAAGISTYNSKSFQLLEELSLFSNNITNIDLSSLSKLRYLNLSNTKLTQLDISSNIYLEELHLNLVGDFFRSSGYLDFYSSLNSLDLSNNLLLKRISGYGINLPNGIDFSNLTQLEYVEFYDNLTYKLGPPHIVFTYIKNVNFNGCFNLKEVYIDCSLNNKSIDLSNRLFLEKLVYGSVNYSLENLDLTNCISLESIYIPNGILNLNFSNCSKLNLVNDNIIGNFSYKNPSSITPKLINLNLYGCELLKNIYINDNNLANLNLTNCLSIENLECQNNKLTSLDLSSCGKLQSINCDNNNLEYISFKNNTNETKTFLNNPNLTYVCADEAEQQSVQYIINLYELWDTCVVGDYCSFTPNGNYNTISGNTIFDSDQNGCDSNDKPFEFLKLHLDDGSNSGTTFSNFEGKFNFYTNEGDFTLTPQLENPSYYSVSPVSVPISFANKDNNTSVNNFCITPNGVHNDLEIVLAPLTPARPGFDAEYSLVFKNKGNMPLSGTVSVVFEDDKLDFVSSSIQPNNQQNSTLSWNFANLMPFENRNITITLNTNSPMETPAVNNDDVLKFTANISPLIADEVPEDNQFVFNQTVVGSFDPNDIYCLEGNTVEPSSIGKYLHYNVRFENTGTFEAENIVIATTINPNDYDINSLQVLNTSHDVFTRIKGNKVEFVFKKIRVKPRGHGNVMLKIKSQSNLKTNDKVSSNASIFFDYNFPVETNDASTLFATLNKQNFAKDSSINIHPNPATEKVTVAAKNNLKSITIYDAQGRIVQFVKANEPEKTIDLTQLVKGIYVLDIISESGRMVEKLFKY